MAAAYKHEVRVVSFDRRRSKARGLLSHRRAQQAVTVGAATCGDFVGKAVSTRPSIALE